MERRFRRGVIQREISRVLVLNLSGEKGGAHRTAQEIFVLDTAFVLIEGAPISSGTAPEKLAVHMKRIESVILEIFKVVT